MSIFAQCFIKFNVLGFKLKALQFYDITDEDPTGMEWDSIIRKLKTKYRSLDYHNLWSPKTTNTKENSNELAGLHTKVNKLNAQVGAQAPVGSGHKFWTCGGNHV